MVGGGTGDDGSEWWCNHGGKEMGDFNDVRWWRDGGGCRRMGGRGSFW